MTKKTSIDWQGCPIRYGASIFGDNWCLMILRDLMFKEAQYFADFLNAGEGVATNILTNRLAHLEKEAILVKLPDPTHGARRLYQLTEKGLALIPAMLEIIDWSEGWDSQTEVPPAFAVELRADRQALAAKIARQLRAKYVA